MILALISIDTANRILGLLVQIRPDEVTRLIESAPNLLYRTLLMLLYATGLRRAEATNLKVSDIDSSLMLIHVHQGKGSRDRKLPLTQKILGALREYWRAAKIKPRVYLFPSRQGSIAEERPSPTKPCGTPVMKRLYTQASVNGSARTRCATMPLRPSSISGRTTTRGFTALSPRASRLGARREPESLACGLVGAHSNRGECRARARIAKSRLLNGRADITRKPASAPRHCQNRTVATLLGSWVRSFFWLAPPCSIEAAPSSAQRSRP
jgi:hypothetical protein